MLGCIKSLASFTKRSDDNVIVTHYFVHRVALISKTFEEILKEVFNQIVQMVNLIKNQDLLNCGYWKVSRT